MVAPVVPVDPTLPTVLAPPSPAATAFDPAAAARRELDRQVTTYAELGVAALLGLDHDGLVALVAPLAARLDDLPADAGRRAADAEDAVPFVLVLPGLDVDAAVPAMRRGNRHGVSVIDRAEAVTYRPLPDVAVPADPYLLWGIDTGSEFCGVRPEDALARVRARGRTPLTLAEGVALATVRPDRLRTNRCWSLGGARTGTNQRVPAVWISQRRSKLGWCWDRNPHTWLGFASAAGRLARCAP